MANGKLWTQPEEDFVEKFYGAKSTKGIAVLLNRSVYAVRTRAHLLGLAMLIIKKCEEGFYQYVVRGDLEIDSRGRIWRVKTRGIPCKRHRVERKMAKGYLRVAVFKNGKTEGALAHRLVWFHFRGEIPNGLTINHINGIKDDNRIENLELATMQEQRDHARDVLGKNGSAKLTEFQVRRIRQRCAVGENQRIIAADFGVSRGTVSNIFTRRQWAHLKKEAVQ